MEIVTRRIKGTRPKETLVRIESKEVSVNSASSKSDSVEVSCTEFLRSFIKFQICEMDWKFFIVSIKVPSPTISEKPFVIILDLSFDFRHIFGERLSRRT